MAAATVSSTTFPLVKKLRSIRNTLVEVNIIPSRTLTSLIRLQIRMGIMTMATINTVIKNRVSELVQISE